MHYALIGVIYALTFARRQQCLWCDAICCYNLMVTPAPWKRSENSSGGKSSISLNHSSIHAAPALYTRTNEKRQWKINNARGWPSTFILLHWIGLLIERAHSITARGKMTNDWMTNVHLSFDFSEIWPVCFIEHNFFNHCNIFLVVIIRSIKKWRTFGQLCKIAD